MRQEITKERIEHLMKELSRGAPRHGDFRVYVVGGGTAVYLGWRRSTIDVDLYSDEETVFRSIQEIKERLNINIEFARPEDFVPALKGSDRRHLFISRIGTVSFYHYDPCAQLLSKIVRGFDRDLEDARSFISSGSVNPAQFLPMVTAIPDASYARYPALSRKGVEHMVKTFLDQNAPPSPESL